MELPQIAIPTYKRSATIAKRTLKFLNKVGYPSNKITLFVASEEEAELYRQVPSDLYDYIAVGELGLRQQRAFISRHYPVGTTIIQMDDDVRGIDVPGDFKDYVRQALERMKQEKAGLYGILPKNDKRCYKDSYTLHLTHILGSFFICVNDPDIITTTNEKEDYERSILYFIKYGKVIRDRCGGVWTTYGKGDGGLQTEGRVERMKLESDMLAKKYPEYCKVIEKNGMPDLSLNWRAHGIPSSDFHEIIKELERKPIDVNKYRANVGEGRSQCFGIVGKRIQHPDLSRQSWRNPFLHQLLLDFSRKHINIPFTSIQVNQNMTCAPHKDKGNVGISAIIAFGDYEGGELVVEGVKHDIKNKIFLFDGSAQEHYTAPFTGNRYSLVYHTIAPQPKWNNIVPAISDYVPVIHMGKWKMKRVSDGTMYWGAKHGLPHPLRGYVR
jgi:hypothetical protein